MGGGGPTVQAEGLRQNSPGQVCFWRYQPETVPAAKRRVMVATGGARGKREDALIFFFLEPLEGAIEACPLRVGFNRPFGALEKRRKEGGWGPFRSTGLHPWLPAVVPPRRDSQRYGRR